MKLPYAEDVGHYWQTSQSSPDVMMLVDGRVTSELAKLELADIFPKLII